MTLAWLSCYSEANCVAVGTYAPTVNTNANVALAEVWNGHTWRASVAARPSSKYVYTEFSGVSCPTTSFCVVSGIYATSDNGYFHTLVESLQGAAHWSVVNDAAPTPQEGYVDYLNDLSCTSATACVAVGEVGNVAAEKTTYHGFAETLTGSTWTRSTVAFPASPASWLSTVSCVSTTFCEAVGLLGNDTYNTTGKAAYARWNGSTWQIHYLSPPPGDGSSLLGLDCVATNYCVASGTEGPYNKPSGHGLTAFWNGTTWTQVNI